MVHWLYMCWKYDEQIVWNGMWTLRMVVGTSGRCHMLECEKWGIEVMEYQGSFRFWQVVKQGGRAVGFESLLSLLKQIIKTKDKILNITVEKLSEWISWHIVRQKNDLTRWRKGIERSQDYTGKLYLWEDDVQKYSTVMVLGYCKTNTDVCVWLILAITKLLFNTVCITFIMLPIILCSR